MMRLEAYENMANDYEDDDDELETRDKTTTSMIILMDLASQNGS